VPFLHRGLPLAQRDDFPFQRIKPLQQRAGLETLCPMPFQCGAVGVQQRMIRRITDEGFFVRLHEGRDVHYESSAIARKPLTRGTSTVLLDAITILTAKTLNLSVVSVAN
jgi:hypothetical protein